MTLSLAAGVRLAAIDLDGTLLDPEKRISPVNLEGARRFAEHGSAVVLASGRMHAVMLPYADALESAQHWPVISYNGAMVRTVGGALISENPVPASLAAEIIDFCMERGLHLNFYCDDTLYVAKLDPWSELYQSRTGSVCVPVGDLSVLKGRTPTKLLIVDTEQVTDALIEPMKARYGDLLYITKTDNEYLEFMNASVSKASALSAVAKSLNVSQQECLAFGDGLNDVPMLEWAGWSVAMSNGKPEARAAAREVAPNERFDAVGRTLERLLETNPLRRENNAPIWHNKY